MGSSGSSTPRGYTLYPPDLNISVRRATSCNVPSARRTAMSPVQKKRRAGEVADHRSGSPAGWRSRSAPMRTGAEHGSGSFHSRKLDQPSALPPNSTVWKFAWHLPKLVARVQPDPDRADAGRGEETRPELRSGVLSIATRSRWRGRRRAARGDAPHLRAHLRVGGGGVLVDPGNPPTGRPRVRRTRGCA